MENAATDDAVATVAGKPKRWYVVHAFSGFEKTVQKALIERIARSEVASEFGQVMPEDDV
jgi:transcription termination/antitermination protein NusG